MKKAKSNPVEATSKPKKLSAKRIGIIVIILLVSLSMIPWVISGKGFSSNDLDSNKWVVVGSKYTVANVILGEYSAFVQKNYYYIQQNPYMLMQYLNNLISQHINTLLFANEAERIGLAVDKDLLLRLISEIPVFKNPDGTFNADEFRSRVTTIFGSEEAFMENVTNNILRDQLLEPMIPLVNQPFFVSYIDLLALSQERTIKYIDIQSLIVKSTLGNPTDADLEKLRDENKSYFTTLETRDGGFLVVDVNKLISNIKITDSEIKEHYERTKASYMAGETRTISQVAFETKELAEQALADLKAGKKITKEFSTIDNIDANSLPEDLSKAIFGAKVNELTGPAQSPVGWHIFKVTKITPAQAKPLVEVKDQIKEDLINTKRTSMLDSKRNDILGLVSQNLSLKEIAAKTGATFQEFKGLSEANIVEKKISEEVYKQIATLEESQNSGIIDDSRGNFFIVHVDKITPATLKSVNEARKDLVELWTNNKIQEKSIELENQIIASVSSGKNISNLGFPVKKVVGTMGDNHIPFSNETIELLFTSNKNIPIAGTLNNQNRVVAVVDSIKNKDMKYETNGKRNQDVVNFNHYVNPNYAQSFFEIYTKILSEKYKIKINEEAIKNRLAPQQ
ncbi:MAG: peptidyl-prolyl cis-trans isomerase [Alphaproteobacteria bacterium]|jgi:peptidyl-prolyl cis-trans isomerase D|nr:peptidyl-prolyl cis-trans isomerase [Alphaproteobacteria bacterium]